MKKLLTILTVFFSLHLSATDRHFAIGGSDASGTGSIGNPFASLGKAASVAVAGDVIKAGAGTFNQTTQVIIVAGVDLDGEGVTTRIKLPFIAGTAYSTAAIMMTSAVEGTNGNQIISDIWFDGNAFASVVGILVRCRSNVIFQNCLFTTYQLSALHLNGKLSEDTGEPPSIFSTGNQVINCKFLDCNDRTLQPANQFSGGSVTYAGQRGLKFLYDTTINKGKAIGHNGNNYGAVQGNNIGTKWFYCVSEKPPDEGTSFNFHIESWYDMGGSEIAYCKFIGGGNIVDVGYGGANKGDSAYAWDIHDNDVSNPFLMTAAPGVQPVLSIFVQFESSTRVAGFSQSPAVLQNLTNGNSRIHHNSLKNIGTLVQIGLANYAGDLIKNITIDHNVMENAGYANNTYSSCLQFGLTNGTGIDSIFADNNTFVGCSGPGAPKGIMILQCDDGLISNIFFRNNINIGITPIPTGAISGYGYLVFRGSIACDNIFSQNNIVFQNAFTNNHFVFPGTPAPTNFTFTNLAADKVNPQFVSSVPIVDYHLATGSPAITGGLNPPQTYRGAYPVVTGNINPGANAGTNQSITWPTNSTTLSGSGSDPDGTIVGYSWAKISGPASYGITGAGSATASVTGMTTGTYQFQLTVIDNSGGTATDVVQVIVNKGAATILQSDLSKVFNNLPQGLTATTSPAGIATSTTYNGVTTQPTNAASYTAITGITDPNWNFTPASTTFTITKQTVIINASGETVNFDGLQHSISATTTPSVPGVSATYTGISGTVYPTSSTPPTAIGTYQVDFILTSANYQATPINVTLTIVSNGVSIFISDTAKIYNGLAQGVTVTTVHPYSLTYNGSVTVPSAAGSYETIATITSGGTGADTATLVIAERIAVLSWVQPVAIPYGSLLTPVQLSATSDISGTWTYSHPLGTQLQIGLTSVTGTFTPTDPANFTGGQVTVSISVFGVNQFIDFFIGTNGQFFFIEQ